MHCYTGRKANDRFEQIQSNSGSCLVSTIDAGTVGVGTSSTALQDTSVSEMPLDHVRPPIDSIHNRCTTLILHSSSATPSNRPPELISHLREASCLEDPDACRKLRFSRQVPSPPTSPTTRSNYLKPVCRPVRVPNFQTHRTPTPVLQARQPQIHVDMLNLPRL